MSSEVRGQKEPIYVLVSRMSEDVLDKIVDVVPDLQTKQRLEIVHLIDAAKFDALKSPFIIRDDTASYKARDWNVRLINVRGKSPARIHELTEGCHVLSVGGGNTFYMMDCFSPCVDVLEKRIKTDYAVFIGISAGAIGPGPSDETASWVNDWRPRRQPRNRAGWHWISCSVVPHTNKWLTRWRMHQHRGSYPHPVLPLRDNEFAVIKGSRVPEIHKVMRQGAIEACHSEKKPAKLIRRLAMTLYSLQLGRT